MADLLSPPRQPTGAGASPPAPSSPDLDSLADSPARRVDYDDLTAIDWVLEYRRERTRQRALAAGASGLAGRVRLLLDASQVWVVLVLTGLAVGAVAAAIDITTDWLGDLKLGFCASGPEGGAFYLSHAFCCFGYDHGSQCSGWQPWGDALVALFASIFTLDSSSSVPAAASSSASAAVTAAWFLDYLVFTLASVLLAWCAAVLVRQYSLYAMHSGIPEIKVLLAGFVIRRFLGAWTLVTKSLGLCLAVASGMWLGREGPLVHVACCCSNLFIKLFGNINDNEARKREVLSAAAAAGISVAFGSPIGGVLFSLEQLSHYFPDKTMWQSFVCAMTAAVTLQAFDPFRSGKLVLYQVKYTTGWHGFELAPYALLGILGGIYGGLFIKTNLSIARWTRANAAVLPGPTTQVALVALLTALVNYPNWFMKVQSTELVLSLFAECSQLLDDDLGLCRDGYLLNSHTIVLLLLAAVLGFGLAALTFGLALPSGIILPSMAVGALTGRAVGIALDLLVRRFPTSLLFKACDPDVVPCVNPAPYAVVAAAAFLAGTTRMTVSIVVIMFELTGALSFVLPIMVAVMIAKLVADAFSRRGIYQAWIHLCEYPYLDHHLPDYATAALALTPPSPPPSPSLAFASAAAAALDSRPPPCAADVMTRIEDLVVLTATGHTLGSLARLAAAHPYRGFPVIADPRDPLLLGYLARADLLHALREHGRARLPDTAVVLAGPAPDPPDPLAPDPLAPLDLRACLDRAPLTLPARASLHLVLAYFHQLGLRYLLLTDRGQLHGLLTKKDVCYLLDAADHPRPDHGSPFATHGRLLDLDSQSSTPDTSPLLR